MGVYLVSVGAEDWSGDELIVAARPALDAALASRNLPGYVPPEAVVVPDGEGDHFEEKFCRDMDSFGALFTRHLADTPLADTLDWDLLIPIEFDGLIELQAPSAYGDTTTVCSAHRVLAAMKLLATAIELPPDAPHRSDNLDITKWFDEVEAGDVSAPEGPWRADLDAAFHVALFLRGAEFSIRRPCPMRII